MSEEKRRSKRQSAGEEGWWECSMCTYRNPPEFFKCEICECRKGTSTRRPRVAPQLVAQQVAQSYLQPPPKKKEKKEKKERPERVEVGQSVSTVAQEAPAVDVDQEVTEVPETKPEVVSPEDQVEGEREEPDIPESQPRMCVPPPGPPKLKKEASTSKPDRETPTHTTKCATAKKSKSSRLKNIDRSSGQSMEVTVNNITVVITDYKLKKDNKSTNASAATGAANISERLNSSTQQALHERDGESKDSFSSSLTDNVQSGGEVDHLANSTVPSAIIES